MKAIVRTRYGSPDVLSLKEIATPVAGDGEVLVRVRASSLNAADAELVRGIFLIRAFAPFRPRDRIPGSDIAGRVEAVGAGVTRFGPGDEVYGDLTEHGFGAFAEYAVAPEEALTVKPAGVSFEDAATVCSAGVIALQGLRDIRSVGPGDHVLINGAGGGMGTFAVQIAKTLGAEVTGVDSASKADMLRSIGADHVIDYASEDFTQGRQAYDLILDMVGGHSLSDCRDVLAPSGAYVLVGGPMTRFLRLLLMGAKGSLPEDRKMSILMWKPNRPGDVAFLKDLLESGKVTPVIDGRYPLERVPDALALLEAGRVLGKAIITL